MKLRRLVAGIMCGAMILTLPGNEVIAKTLSEPIGSAIELAANAITEAGHNIADGVTSVVSDIESAESESKAHKMQEEVLEETVEDKKKELADNEGQYAEDSIVLENTSKEQAESIAAKIEGATYRITEQEDFAVIYLPEGTSIDEVYEDEEMEALVPDMSPDYYVDTTSLTEDARGRQLMATKPDYEVNDTEYDMQQELSYVNMKDTWKKTKGAGVTVAVIDTGIDTDNPEFEGRISKYSYNASHDKIVKDYDVSVIEDEQGHGTAVAGTLAAGMDGKGIAGIATEAERRLYYDQDISY